MDNPPERPDILIVESGNRPLGIGAITSGTVINAHDVAAISLGFKNDNSRGIGILGGVGEIDRSKDDLFLAILVQVTPSHGRPGILAGYFKRR